MSKLGKPVYKVWSRRLRFGNVIEERNEKGWSYYKVNWVKDGEYERSIQDMLKLRGEEYDPKYEWYRRDHINFFEPDKVVARINKLEVK